jgi:hypothetical protein
MSIRGRVGRHTQDGGRQCQNWADDQKTVTGLLNRIAVNNGGTAGSLNAPIRPGICGDALYSAIVQFENKHLGGQRNGYVDPGGAMLKRLETLAANPASVAPTTAAVPQRAETRLDILRRNVLNIAAVVAKFHGDSRWTAGDRVQLDRLVQIATRHIDALGSVKYAPGKPLEALPWWGEVFGSVIVDFSSTYSYSSTPRPGQSSGIKYSGDVKPRMQYGYPVTHRSTLVTGTLPALLLFSDGVCYPLRSNDFESVDEMHQYALDGFVQ